MLRGVVEQALAVEREPRAVEVELAIVAVVPDDLAFESMITTAVVPPRIGTTMNRSWPLARPGQRAACRPAGRRCGCLVPLAATPAPAVPDDDAVVYAACRPSGRAGSRVCSSPALGSSGVRPPSLRGTVLDVADRRHVVVQRTFTTVAMFVADLGDDVRGASGRRLAAPAPARAAAAASRRRPPIARAPRPHHVLPRPARGWSARSAPGSGTCCTSARASIPASARRSRRTAAARRAPSRAPGPRCGPPSA